MLELGLYFASRGTYLVEDVLRIVRLSLEYHRLLYYIFLALTVGIYPIELVSQTPEAVDSTQSAKQATVTGVVSVVEEYPQILPLGEYLLEGYDSADQLYAKPIDLKKSVGIVFNQRGDYWLLNRLSGLGAPRPSPKNLAHLGVNAIEASSIVSGIFFDDAPLSFLQVTQEGKHLLVLPAAEGIGPAYKLPLNLPFTVVEQGAHTFEPQSYNQLALLAGDRRGVYLLSSNGKELQPARLWFTSDTPLKYLTPGLLTDDGAGDLFFLSEDESSYLVAIADGSIVQPTALKMPLPALTTTPNYHRPVMVKTRGYGKNSLGRRQLVLLIEKGTRTPLLIDITASSRELMVGEPIGRSGEVVGVTVLDGDESQESVVLITTSNPDRLYMLLPFNNLFSYPVSLPMPIGPVTATASLDLNSDSQDEILLLTGKGSLLAARTNRKIPLSNVQLLTNQGLAAKTDISGAFSFAATSETRTVSAQRIGYQFSPRVYSWSLKEHLGTTIEFFAHESSLPRPAKNSGAEHQPGICIGYDRVIKSWRPQQALCPEAHAYFSAVEGKTPFSKFDHCCPLPSADILTDSHEFVSAACPSEHILTGEIVEGDKQLFRCTKINTERYQLGPRVAARYWGIGVSAWNNVLKEMINRSQIPQALQFNLGRIDQKKWNSDGCVGYPFGALFTDRTSNSCNSMAVQVLQYRGWKSDPPLGTAVEMFPSCVAINDKFSPTPQCVVPK